MAKRADREEQPPIARALDFLLRNHRDDDGNPVTVEKVAAGIDQQALSAPYIYALRSGNKRNPTVSTLELLARYFGVRIGFFFVDDPAAAYAAHRQEAVTTSPDVTEAAESVAADPAAASEAPAPPVPADLAGRLRNLFDLRPRPDGNTWSMRQVSSAARAMGVPLSVGFLNDLRRGIRDNPTKQQLECLAAIFEVHPSYFFDDDETLAEIDKKLATLDALGDERVADIAARAKNLNAHDFRMLSALIDSALGDGSSEDPDS